MQHWLISILKLVVDELLPRVTDIVTPDKADALIDSINDVIDQLNAH